MGGEDGIFLPIPSRLSVRKKGLGTFSSLSKRKKDVEGRDRRKKKTAGKGGTARILFTTMKIASPPSQKGGNPTRWVWSDGVSEEIMLLCETENLLILVLHKEKKETDSSVGL